VAASVARRALIPMAEGLALLGELPEGVTVELWDATGPPPGGGAGVGFWVPPFTPLGQYAERFAQLPDLRVAQTLTSGFEHVIASLPPGVTLCNAGGVHDGPVAEWAVTLLLSVLRRVPFYVRAQANGAPRDGESQTLVGRTVMLLGHGGIGRAIERRLQGFETEIVRVASRPRDGVHGPEDLPALLPRCDAVIVAVPLGPDTRGLVDAAFLARLPDGAVLVNIARGAVVDQDALAAELWSGRLHAALDVATPDPLPADDPLRACPNLLYSPHVAGATSLTLPRVFGFAGDQIRRWAAGAPLVNVVAGPELPHPSSSAMPPQ
jgi:phosphoglycerate dehydrogenase-like enzyme